MPHLAQRQGRPWAATAAEHQARRKRARQWGRPAVATRMRHACDTEQQHSTQHTAPAPWTGGRCAARCACPTRPCPPAVRRASLSHLDLLGPLHIAPLRVSAHRLSTRRTQRGAALGCRRREQFPRASNSREQSAPSRAREQSPWASRRVPRLAPFDGADAAANGRRMRQLTDRLDGQLAGRERETRTEEGRRETRRQKRAACARMPCPVLETK